MAYAGDNSGVADRAIIKLSFGLVVSREVIGHEIDVYSSS